VDTTEAVQQDMDFWSWLEQNLVGPLVVEGQVRMIFAGRVPVPWRRFEVRRAVQLHSLGPLPVKEAARELLAELLKLQNPGLLPEEIEQAIPLLIDLSLGHPLLSEELAADAASRLPQALEQKDEFRYELSERVVTQFISSFLFADVGPPWTEILRWACILRQFDPMLLGRYLAKLNKDLVTDKKEVFFIRGLAMLRTQEAIVWNAGEGTAVHGILRDILRRNLEILNPSGFKQACLAAADVYAELAAGFPEDSEGAEHYRQEAERYRKECQTLGSQKENSSWIQ